MLAIPAIYIDGNPNEADSVQQEMTVVEQHDADNPF